MPDTPLPPRRIALIRRENKVPVVQDEAAFDNRPTMLPPMTITAQAPDLTERFGNVISRIRNRIIESRNRDGLASRIPAPMVHSVLRGLAHFRPTSAESARRERERNESALLSPLGDSLMALSGGGRPRVQANRFAMYQPGQGVRSAGTAEYNPWTDNVTLGNAQGAWEGRNALIHEMGHRRNFRTKQGIAGMLRPDYGQTDKVPGKQYRETNSVEGYAVAFEQAFQLLDQLRKQSVLPPNETIQRILKAREQRVPGTTRLFNELLADPLYQNHPLRQRPP